MPRQQKLDELVAEHRALKERIRQLDRHLSLTSEEQVEYMQLKKLKLRAKDQIRLLTTA
ncbi:MAG TPA: YdcH family protein [Kofleriaceae bacterium]|nr:YdcH family protein [Kofleriaceae bacterium]